ncbi:translocation/assembly module TamB domain-containing protein [Dyadobacter sandarakinus]|uniref:Translocation/assembly module TamB domain-containing protein n=1 Tax=Dyadobacter sandarakinus TaxID=2747268 RepID=A0ABX7I7B4_9BACT|nr:translocation/assembly module TamB domain-containing protein [Dyadobacter sandarakinus]QRR01991.1 translocation/assembly module TamB domain-containing protein [Dyadobacter sandarakinus]
MLKFLKAFGNGLVVVIIFALLALGIATIALQLPSVQTWAVRYATSSISEKLHYPISIGKVNIKWFDVVSLENVSVKDSSRKDLIDVGRIDVNLNVRNIMENASREIYLDEVNVYQPNVKLAIVPETGYLNIDGFIESINRLTAPATPRPKDAPENNTPFIIGRSKVIDGTFSYDDPRKPHDRRKRVFDYSHFQLTNLNGELKDFLVQGDTIAFQARNLRTTDRQTGLAMRDLDTRFLFCQKKMELKELDAQVGSSHLKDEIIFNYNRSGELGDFNHKILMQGHLVGSRVSAEDLGLFSEYIDALHETWYVSGNFYGKVDDFTLSAMNLRFGQGSTLAGSVAFKGLPEMEGVQMDIHLAHTQVQPADLVQYYPEWDQHDNLKKFGTTTMDGSFKGTLEDFTVNAQAGTKLGQLGGDLVFHIADSRSTTYSGKVKTIALDLGTLLDQKDTWQKLDFDGEIHGKGLEIQYASTDMNALVSRVGFRNYEYRNIRLKGNLQNQYFNGQVSARDSNLLASLEGEFDLTGVRNAFDVQGVIERANLQELGLTADPITLRTQLNINVNGNSIDELTGDARLLNTYLLMTSKERNLVIDTLVFSSTQNENLRSLRVESEFLTARAEGPFLPTRAWADITSVLDEYKLYFFENAASRAEYYARKPLRPVQDRYQIDYEVETRNLARFLAFLNPDIHVSKGARAEGFFKMDNTAFLTLSASADTLRYGKNQFVKSDLDVTTSKFVNSAEVLASVLVTSQQQQISALVPTEKLEMEGTWDVDHIDFNGAMHQVKSTNMANLAGEIRFLPAGFDVSFKNSRLNLLDEEWTVPSESLISFAGSSITFSNMGLVSGKQRISLNGTASEDADKTLMIDVKNFGLGSLNPVLNTQLAGIMDGSARIKNVYHDLILDVAFNVESLGYASYEFGNLAGTGDWDQFSKELQIDAQLNKNARRVFLLTGAYRPQLAENTLNLRAVFNYIDFKALEPFAEGLISDVSGTANGTVQIKGMLTAPVLEGSLMVDKGRMKFDYLQSVFTFSDKINFTESEITVNNIIVTDADGNTATVRGGVFHDGFKYFSLGFNADLHNFKILNTVGKDNTMFYGTAYVTGPVAVYGPIDNMSIEANVTSNKGTRIYIPLDGATEVVTQDYIQFVSKLPADSAGAQLADSVARSQLSGGIKMDFNFNLTPDATCEIIFDRQTGDILRGNGSGRLNLNIDTKGDFTMAGTYEIERGEYNFTLQNVINKKFSIKPGSRIIWSGDPYGAQLDVKAGYTQMVSLLGVLPSTSTSGGAGDALSRRYPVEVTIGLSNGLMSPTIRYDLKILDNPSLSAYRGQLEAFQNKLKSDEQELSRQVSSLLVVNQLLPETSLAGQTNQNFLGSSISELVSNQISRWASGINENLEVGVSGLSLDQNALNNLQLRFSYRFLNDRFRVTRDGRFTSGAQNGVVQYNAATLLGEWTLEYWLNNSGSVRVKAYNRNVQNPFSLNTATTGGVSMQFTHSFNRLLPIQKPELKVPYVVPADSVRQDTTANKMLSEKKDSR